MLNDFIRRKGAQKRHEGTIFGPFLAGYIAKMKSRKLADRTIKDNLYAITNFGEYLRRCGTTRIADVSWEEVRGFLCQKKQPNKKRRTQRVRFRQRGPVISFLEYLRSKKALCIPDRHPDGPLKSLFQTEVSLDRHKETVFGAYLDDFVVSLGEKGFKRGFCRRNVFVVTRFGEYLIRKDVRSVDRVNLFHVEQFHRAERKRLEGKDDKKIAASNRAILLRFLEFLQDNKLISPPPASQTSAPLEMFYEDLRKMRGLTPVTIDGYRHFINEFLKCISSKESATDFSSITPETIEHSIVILGHRYGRRSMRCVCTAIRGLLRYLYRIGTIDRDLSVSVMMPRFYSLERLPCALPWDRVQMIFSAVPSTPQGHRDRAILWLLVSYGVRPGEVVKLRLDDIDWRNETIQFRRSKAGRPLHFPLTQEVGESILIYLQKSRPSTNAREIFIRIDAPHTSLSRGTVISNLVRGYLQKAGIKTKHTGAGVIRHSLAVHLVRKGHPLKTITDVLGHQDPRIAYHYTKLATEDLHAVALSAEEVMP